jgi:AcrR family transcriptional regulator
MGIQERQQREKKRRHQQIMVAAKRIFTDKGFSKATMGDIAQEAELSPGTLYLYFKSKEELYASLSLRVLQYLLIRAEHVNDEKDAGPEEKLKALIDALYDVYEFDPLTFNNVFHLQSSETLKNLSPQLRTEITDLSRKSLCSFAKIFQDGFEQDLFMDCHPIALADIFWSMFSGIVLWLTSKRLIDKEKDFLKPTLEFAFEVFVRGIKKN